MASGAVISYQANTFRTQGYEAISRITIQYSKCKLGWGKHGLIMLTQETEFRVKPVCEGLLIQPLSLLAYLATVVRTMTQSKLSLPNTWKAQP